mgnify:CR=1 FL=1
MIDKTRTFRISYFLRDEFRTRQVRMVCALNEKDARQQAENIRPPNTWNSFNLKKLIQ